MIDTFDYNGIEIPSEVTPAAEVNESWVMPLARQELQTANSPAEVWACIFDVIFKDTRFTENHKYAICMLVSADMVKTFVMQQYGDILQAYHQAMAEAEEELILPKAPQLILP